MRVAVDGTAVPRRLVLRTGLTVVFRRMNPHAAVEAFRRGDLDEAPVPQGEIRATQADPMLGNALHARELHGLDVAIFPRGLPDALLRAYRLTAPRSDYQQLIAERVARAVAPASAGDFRRARASLRTLPRIPLTFGIPQQPELAEAAELVWAEWRQLGFPLTRVPDGVRADVRFRRLVPAPSARRRHVVALGWVAEARLVSPRVRGWRMDEVGLVDYSRVSLEPGG